MKNFGEMLIGKKPSKKQENREVNNKIISIHEESGDIIKDREGLSIEEQDQTIIKEHLDLTDEGFEDTPSKEKKIIPTEELSDYFDWETYILNKIDNPDSELETIDEIKVPAGVHRPQFINEIIKKYSLPANEWQKLTPEQKQKNKQAAQKEVQELYIKQPKKMVRKKNDKEMAA